MPWHGLVTLGEKYSFKRKSSTQSLLSTSEFTCPCSPRASYPCSCSPPLLILFSLLLQDVWIDYLSVPLGPGKATAKAKESSCKSTAPTAATSVTVRQFFRNSSAINRTVKPTTVLANHLSVMLVAGYVLAGAPKRKKKGLDQEIWRTQKSERILFQTQYVEFRHSGTRLCLEVWNNSKKDPNGNV